MLKFRLRLVLVCAIVPCVALGLSPAKATDYTYDVDFSIFAYGNSGVVNFSGDIVTTCNQCFLNPSDVASYEFIFSNPGVNGAVESSSSFGRTPSFFVNPNFSTLVALPSAIIFDPIVGDNVPSGKTGIDYFENVGQPANSNSFILSFSSLNRGACSANCGQISLYGPSEGAFELALGFNAVFWPDFLTIANFGCVENFPGNCIQGLSPPKNVQYNGGGNFLVDGNPLFVTSPTPLPAAFPLFATGLGGLGFLGWRRKRNQPRKS